VRDYVLGNLRGSTKCGTDRYDQSFGIPTAFAKPWAVKQGWSGFGDRPANPCTATAALPLPVAPAPVPAVPALLPAVPALLPAQAARAVDMSGEVLHTTGSVGPDDRAIVAILSVHPNATPYAKATANLNALTRSLSIPGATPAS
jgi:hypothetical protein